MSSESTIDLPDPADLKARIKRYEEERATQEIALATIQRHMDKVDAFLTHYRGLLRLVVTELDGTDPEESDPPEGEQIMEADARPVGVTEKCVELLQSGPMNLTQLMTALNKVGIFPKNRNALNATLYTAANKGRIKRLGSGVYGPLKPQGLEQQM